MSKEHDLGDKGWFVRFTKDNLAIVAYGEIIEFKSQYRIGSQQPWRTYRVKVTDGYGALAYETNYFYDSWLEVHEIARKNNDEVLERFTETVKSINGDNVESKSRWEVA